MDINVKKMDMETLRALQAQIAAEIKARCSSNLVIYTHGCKDAAKHHLSKYKHWAKLVTAVDTTKTDGYAFIGDFLRVTSEHKVPVGSIIVEVCDKDILCYIMEASGKHRVYSGSTGSMSSFIDDVASLY